MASLVAVSFAALLGIWIARRPATEIASPQPAELRTQLSVVSLRDQLMCMLVVSECGRHARFSARGLFRTWENLHGNASLRTHPGE